MSTVVSIFRTELGWFGLAGRDERVARLCFGHRNAGEVQRRVERELEGPFQLDDWHAPLRERLQAYAEGIADSFADVAVESGGGTPFQQRVLRRLREVAYGETLSYGELARRAGTPGAARAVGRVMASNRIPIIFPCHRVLAAHGALGGFSAPQGTALKRRLLELEGAAGFAGPDCGSRLLVHRRKAGEYGVALAVSR